MFSDLSPSNSTVYVFFYDMIIILQVEYVESMYFFNSICIACKVYTPNAILGLTLAKELSQNHQLPYFCPIITNGYHLAAESINRLEFFIPI